MADEDDGPQFHEVFSDEERETLAHKEFAICVARFYDELAESLVNGATEGFALAGVTPASTHVIDVPGAFELPMAAKLCKVERLSFSDGTQR